MDKTGHYLGYLEIPAASGCNLKCRGCSHFSNVPGHSYLLSEDEFGRDITRLAELVPFIHTIRLLGGEPFLNPAIGRIADMARRVYGRSHIWIVTNGLLLPDISGEVLRQLAEADAEIQISLYPPTREQLPAIAEKLASCGLPFSVTGPIRYFRKRMNSLGDSDPEYEFEHCPVGRDCHYLYRGKLSACPAPQLADVLYDRFGFDSAVREKDTLDIHRPGLTFGDIRAFLDRAPSVCRFCTEPELFEWTTEESPELNDWLVK